MADICGKNTEIIHWNTSMTTYGEAEKKCAGINTMWQITTLK